MGKVIFAANDAPPIGTRVSRLEFRNRMTLAEKEAIYTAALTSARLRVFLDDLAAVQTMDMAAAQTIAGVQSLEDAGLIAPGRAAEILAGGE